jgi:hypothetical protein
VKRVVRSLILCAVVITALLIAPAAASAQHRAVPRPATRPVYGHGGPYHGGYYRPYYGYYRPYYYAPYYYPPFGFYGGYGGWYSGFGIGFSYGYPGWHGAYAYPGAYGYPYSAYSWDYGGAARIQVQPRHAEVFIDGHFVGTVDDFDGWLQRLNVAPGEHELAIYLKGHRTFHENVLFRPGATLRVEHVMQPLAAGEAEEPRPVPAPSRSPARSTTRAPRDYSPDVASPDDPARQQGAPVPAPRRGAPEPPSPGDARTYGSLAIRVQPLDADVIVDGEPWQSPQAGSITLQLSDGIHKVEVRKDGYRTYAAEVRVRRGDTTSLNVSLSRDQPQGIDLVVRQGRKMD